MTDLCILCVTRAEAHAKPLLQEMSALAEELGGSFMVAADGDAAWRNTRDVYGRSILVRSQGFIESVLDEAVAACPDGWILRLDDDERCSPGMVKWLRAGGYRTSDHWAFPRENLFPDERHRFTGDLWPDLQTRLSSKAKSGGRTRIHAGSPFGTGTRAPVHIEHHKYLLLSANERLRRAHRYEQAQRGAGTGHYLQFQVPDICGIETVSARQTVPV